jgi:outer membrane protease
MYGKYRLTTVTSDSRTAAILNRAVAVELPPDTSFRLRGVTAYAIGGDYCHYYSDWMRNKYMSFDYHSSYYSLGVKSVDILGNTSRRVYLNF